jgi:hypothetical protein
MVSPPFVYEKTPADGGERDRNQANGPNKGKPAGRAVGREMPEATDGYVSIEQVHPDKRQTEGY